MTSQDQSAAVRVGGLPPAQRSAGDRGRFAGLRIVAALGRGTDSEVYRVRREEPGGGEFALKVLSAPSPESARQALVSFRREAALLASVAHPGLPAIHEVGEHEGRPYLVMDLVEGRSLANVLAEGPVSPERAIGVVRDVAGPLGALHDRGLVHRDVKPANIIIQPSGQAVLIDFGLTARASSSRSNASSSRSDVAVGTLAYAPPEQSGMLKRAVDGRSDLYSVGVVLFESLAGRLPFEAADVGELIRLHTLAPPPDVRELVTGVGPGLAAVVATLLAKDPDDRYQHAAELDADLALLAADPVQRRAGRARPGGLVRLAPVGRARELALLETCWREARAGSGRACVLRGPGGSGKSVVAGELVRRATAAGATVLVGKSSVDDPLPLGPLRAALEAYLASAVWLGPDAQARAHKRLAAAAGPAGGILAGLSPALATALGSTRSGDTEDQLTLAVTDLLIGLARQPGGLVLVLDDLQWLDEATGRVLLALAPQLQDVPLLLLTTARNDPDSQAATERVLTCLDEAEMLDLTLGPLDESAIAELVDVLLPGADPSTGLACLLATRAGGNAFVATEYLRAIVDAGLLRPDWGRWVLDTPALDALELPQDAVGLVLTRVRALGPAVLDILVTAAVVGPRFRPSVIAAVRDLPLDAVLAMLAEAAGYGLIEARDGGDHAFLHDRIREALLADLDDVAAAGTHARIAQALDDEPVPVGGHPADHVYATARHYLAAGPADPLTAAPADSSSPDPKGAQRFAHAARVACVAAGELALAEHVPAEAVRFLRAATDLADPAGTPPDPNLSLAFGRALKEAGHHEEALEQVQQVLRTGTDPLLRARAHLLEADVHRASWNPRDGQAAVSRGLAELGAMPPRHPLLKLASTLSRVAAVPMLRRLPAVRVRDESSRARCTLIAELHFVGSYLGSITPDLGASVLHALRGWYWATRLGTGEQFVRTQSQIALIPSMLGLRRAADRARARAEADPAAAAPGTAALLAYGVGLTFFFGYRDNGQLCEAGLRNHGHRLDLASYADWTHVVVTNAACQGRVSEAEGAVAASWPRARLRSGEITNLIFTVPHVLAARGRHADAARALQQVEKRLDESCPMGLAVHLHLARLLVLTEQREFGAPFDRTIEEYEALGFPQPPPVRLQRIITWVIAMGRLAQCRLAAATDDEAARQARLQQARSAVRLLRRAARGDEFTARWRITRADLYLLQGRPRRAWRLLSRWYGVLEPDMPGIAYETARVRARTLQALGDHAEAHRQATLALGLARENGWPHRVRWVADEFGIVLDNTLPGGTSRSAAASRCSTPWRTSGTGEPADAPLGTASAPLERSRLAALEQVSLAASQVLDPRELARITLDEVIKILAADRAVLFLLDDQDHLMLHLGRDGTGQDVTELGGYGASLVERVRRTKEPVVVTGTEEGAALGSVSAVQHGLRSIMAAPLLIEERLLGVAYLDSQLAKGIFTQDDAGILMALTNHIATSLETARAAQLEISVRAAQRERDLADLLRFAQEDMAGVDEPGDVLARMVVWAARLVGGDRGWVVIDPTAGDATAGDPGLRLTELADDTRPVTRTIDRTSALTDLLVLAEPTVHPPDRPLPEPLRAREPRHGSTGPWITLPLHRVGVLTGVLVLASREPAVHPADHLEVAAALVAQALTAHERVTLFTQVQALAVRDELTGIANRRHFLQTAERDLERAAQDGRGSLALMMDIDHFKAVNDTYGHPTGDDVIRVVAERLVGALRQTDLIGRYGGEEFVALLPGGVAATQVPERLRAAIADEPITTRSGPLSITVSIGKATWTDGDDLPALLTRADEALYRAKRDGRNRVADG